jgi:hypothetical protein
MAQSHVSFIFQHHPCAPAQDDDYRITLSFFAMWNYDRLNQLKETACTREGTTRVREYEFREMSDDSPLFRYDDENPTVVILSPLYFPATQSNPRNIMPDRGLTTG